MPRLSQLMIRTALVWLALGYSLGGLVLLNKGVPLLPWLWALRSSHIHILLVGWTVQLACGVAFWILPRLDAGGSRGDERLVWGCYLCLNVGVALAALHGPLTTLPAAAPIGGALLIVVGLAYLAAALLFLLHAWPRVVPFRLLPRPARAGPDNQDDPS
ncbi:MAG: hypothetical protein IPO81_22250 [Kouleothrix sp.]|nr:hypothetical protein [Kouleothrix sp.]